MICYLMLQGGKLIAFIITELFRVNQQRVKKKLLKRVTILDLDYVNYPVGSSIKYVRTEGEGWSS